MTGLAVGPLVDEEDTFLAAGLRLGMQRNLVEPHAGSFERTCRVDAELDGARSRVEYDTPDRAVLREHLAEQRCKVSDEAAALGIEQAAS